ncbi:protein disulfide isomerase A6 [Echinococcus multilocularis]|uniref:protein disulfide-isomerase n=1 Tax=Echinococcus multilocularis TaxID=6211 RepID=A0A068YG56_ECHMU|nr:protein disulfide isomerase A6 [Echinococcus multilocularis]
MWQYLCFLLAFTHTCFALYGGDDSVIQLNGQNFDEFISQPGVTVVKFYASWCSHCERFAPKFKKASDILQGVVRFGVVDNEAHSNIGNRFNVEGYPTVLVFRSDEGTGNPIKYTGPRTSDELIVFLMGQVRDFVVARARKEGVRLNLSPNQPTMGSGGGTCGGAQSHADKQDNHYQNSEAVVTLTDQNFDSLVLQSDDDWLVAFIAPWCGHCKNLAPEWKRAAEKLKGKVKVGTVDATVHNNLAGRYEIRGFPTIKYFKSGQVEEYNGMRSAEGIVEFGLQKAELNRPPPEVNEITSSEVLHEACDNKQLCIIGFLPQLLDCQSKCRRDYLGVMKEAAKKHKGKNWGWLWSAARTHMHLEEALQVGGFGYPTMVAISMRKQKFAVMHGSFATDGVRDFLYDLSQGRGSVSLNSMSTLPEIQSSAPWDGKDAPVIHEKEIDLSELGMKISLLYIYGYQTMNKFVLCGRINPCRQLYFFAFVTS